MFYHILQSVAKQKQSNKKGSKVMKKTNKFIVSIILALSLFISTQVFAIQQQGDVTTSSATVTTASTAVSGPAVGVAGGLLNDSFNSADEITNMAAPIPGNVPVAPTLSYFGKSTKSHNYMPAKVVTLYRNWFTEKALEEMLKNDDGILASIASFFSPGGDIVVNYSRFDSTYTPATQTDADGNRWIMIVVTEHKENETLNDILYKDRKEINVGGLVIAHGEDNDSVMPHAVVKAALKVLRNGDNVFQIIAEGINRDAFSISATAGISDTFASIFNNLAKSNVASVGGSATGADAGTRDKPWIHGFAISDPAAKPPIMIAAEDVVKEAAKAKQLEDLNAGKTVELTSVDSDTTVEGPIANLTPESN